MENRFNNRDFEQFVKQNADQYRMFPSEKVWNGIHNSLHTRRRWYGIGLGLLLLTTGVVTWVMLTSSGKNKQLASQFSTSTINQPVAGLEKKQNDNVVIAPAKVPFFKTSFITPTGILQKDLFIKDISSEPVVDNKIKPAAIVFTDQITVPKVETKHQIESIVNSTPPVSQVVDNKPVINTFRSVWVNDFSFSAINNSDKKEITSTDFNEIISDKNINYPLSIESVINSYTHIQKKKKPSLQVYFAPSISYRELKENKSFINSARNSANGTTNAYYSTDINNVVTHKPDIGLLLGFTAGYPLLKNLNLIGGLQFSVSKYDIKAYTYPSEVATIALRSNSGGTNTVSTVTNYRNSGGSSKVNWLHNLYFSASAPIGLELKLMGNRKNYLGVSGTIQPTFVLRNSAYLLSTDYKNYAEIPSLTRKWNINTGFELFAGYSTGQLKWRVGPQVRYQTMSSFQKKYPVQEHLFDFGLKLGVMLNK